ncbi:MAG: DUF5723 family protein [Spirochaetaceae bacterium]|jgi:hypothetical protein|nr:DUF5723 family protein [Spirochaetaceae bacterium]
MKKSLYTVLLLISIVSLWAEKPRRYFEIGADVSGGVANNYLFFGDIFQETITIDLNAISDKMADNGLQLNVAADAEAFVNINFGSKFGIGFFAGTDALMYGSLPKSLFEFISEGNKEAGKVFEGNAAAGGSVFADVGFHVSGQAGRFKYKVKPAMFIPLIYIPKPDISYTLQTSRDGTIYIDGKADVNVYAPVPLHDNSDSFTYELSDLNRFLDGRGFDLSLDVEFELLSMLDLGLSVVNIPLLPAELNHKMGYSVSFNIHQSGMLDQLIDNEFNSDDVITDSSEESYSDNESYKVRRPLTFELYALFRPFKSDFIVLRPNVALSLFTVYDKPVFGAGVMAQLNIKRLFSLDFGFGYEELLWKTKLGFVLNLRVLELNVMTTLQSQNFLNMYKLNGLNAAVGVRIGI